MKEFANPFVIFEVAGVTMFLAFIALLICVASWYIQMLKHIK